MSSASRNGLRKSAAAAEDKSGAKDLARAITEHRIDPEKSHPGRV